MSNTNTLNLAYILTWARATVLITCCALISLSGYAVASLITFDEVVLPSNSSISDEYAHLGLNFENSFYDVQGWDLPTGRHIANFSPNVHYPFLEISFSDDVLSASFLFITNRENIRSGPPGQSTFQALRDGLVVEQYAAATDLTQSTYGFSNIVFDQVRVYPGGRGGYGRLDNLAFRVVPEPECIAILALASVCLSVLRFRVV